MGNAQQVGWNMRGRMVQRLEGELVVHIPADNVRLSMPISIIRLQWPLENIESTRTTVGKIHTSEPREMNTVTSLGTLPEKASFWLNSFPVIHS